MTTLVGESKIGNSSELDALSQVNIGAITEQYLDQAVLLGQFDSPDMGRPR